MSDIIRRHWPLFAALGLFCAVVTTILVLSISRNQGHFIYAVDDAYIHMALAKNFAQHGVWGVTKYSFASASSSLLWMMTLSLSFFLFGARELIPLILNFVFAILLIVWCYLTIRKHTTRPRYIFLLLTTLVLLAPLPTLSLVFSGMEHTLHILINLAFVYLSATLLAKEKQSVSETALLMTLALLVVAVRYEGLFVVFIVGCLFLLRRRLISAVLVGAAGWLPVVVYGLYSVSKGWHFLPNTILLKGNTIDFSSLNWKGVIVESVQYALNGYWQMGRNPHILMLFLGAIIIIYLQLRRRKQWWTRTTMLLTVFTAITYLHMQFAKADWSDSRWYARYDAYLVCLGILALGISLLEYLPEKFDFKSMLRPQNALLALLALFVALPFVLRAGVLIPTVRATNNIYEQQYQMSLFLREYYQGQGVALNDIGATNYFADIKCLDLWGLASMEIAKAKRSRSFDKDAAYEIAKAHNVKVAIVYKQWFLKYNELFTRNYGVPEQWIEVGEWTIPNNYICGDSKVTFYAVDPAERDALVAHLREFSARLPADVVQRGAYRN